MSGPADILRRYFEQRGEMGERAFVAHRKDAWQLPAPSAHTDPARADGPERPQPTPQAGASRRSRGARTPADPAPPRAGGASEEPRWKREAPPIPESGIVVAAPDEDLFASDPLTGLDLDGIATRVHGCRACALAAGRTHAVPGEGSSTARLVVVGEGPGATEDETGRPFVGRAGELLTGILASIELRREEVFICNVVKCRPPANRKPQQEEIDACVGYLHRQLDILRPAVILAMGGTAAETLLGVKQSLGQLRNRVHEFRGIPLVVTYHPAALLRNPNWKKPTWHDVCIARQLLERH